MKHIFDSMPQKDGISWNAVISGYANHNSPHDAVNTYHHAKGASRLSAPRPIWADKSTARLSSTGSSSPLVGMYSKVGLIGDAKKVFDWMESSNVIVYNTMLTGFLKCGMIEDSKKLFGEMRERDSISWTTMVTGLTQVGSEREAQGFFREMRAAGLVLISILLEVF